MILLQVCHVDVVGDNPQSRNMCILLNEACELPAGLSHLFCKSAYMPASTDIKLPCAMLCDLCLTVILEESLPFA